MWLVVDPGSQGRPRSRSTCATSVQGLDGETLETVTEAYEVTVRRVPFQNPANLDGSYNIDHTGTYFVVDRRGRIRLHHPPNATAEELVPDLATLIAEG